MPATYLNFDLEVLPDGDGWTTRARSPRGEAKAPFQLPLSFEGVLPRGRTAMRGRQGSRSGPIRDVDEVKAFGQSLFEALFQGDVLEAYRESLAHVRSDPDLGLRIRLRLGEAPDLVSVPWEYLYDRRLDRFLALNDETPVVRYLDLPLPSQPLVVEPPLRVLVAISSPDDVEELDVEQEWRRVNEALEDLIREGAVLLHRLEPVTVSNLRWRLKADEFHVFHFIGHGGVDAVTDRGVLLLEGQDGGSDVTEAETLAGILSAERTLRLAVLNACEGGRASAGDIFAGTAQALARQGVPAVIAMQFEVSDEAAITLTHDFYKALAFGDPVDAALTEARRGLRFERRNELEWGTPVLYMRAGAGRLFAVRDDRQPAAPEGLAPTFGPEGRVGLRPQPGEPLKVGVLSFAEVGTTGDHEALGDGFAEELITRLSRVDELSVLPRRSMLQFKGKRLSIGEIARRLKLNYLVEGTFRGHGKRCRVDASVIQTWDDGQWRDQWERSLPELFELQADVAEGVAGHLMGVLRRGGMGSLKVDERTALRREPSRSVPAHYAYMQGRRHLHRFNNGREAVDFRAAELAFLQALELDESYLDAQAELGFLYLVRWETEGGPDWLDRSEAEFRRVLDRDPHHPMAEAVLGYVTFVNGRTGEGLDRVEAAARRHHRETIPENQRALLHMYVGFYESAVHITETRIVRLDPGYVYPPTNASTCCLLMGDHAGALRWAEHAEVIDPAAFIVRLVEGAAWFHRGDRQAADRAWRRGSRVAPVYIKPLFRVTRAWIDVAGGDVAAGRTVVREHREDDWLRGAYDPYFISLCALTGEHDLAFDLLERQTTWASSYRYLIGDPTLRSLHADPRFRALLERRFERWNAFLERGHDLPVPPPELPGPGEFAPS